MITSLDIKNLRSISDLKMDIAPLTVLYGPNGSGKSSIIYGLPIFKSIILNPNQSTDGFFNLTFINLGGFDQVIFDHKPDKMIELSIALLLNGVEIKYGVSIGKKDGAFTLDLGNELRTSIPIVFPYPANTHAKFKYGENEITWNGLLVV
jgi:AAA15 family ATPase/GTPase